MTNQDTLTPTQNERLLAALSHLFILIPHFGFVAPTIIWITQIKQKDKSQYIAFQSFQALTYQLFVFAVWLIGNACSISSVFIFNTYLLFPIMGINLIGKYFFIAYGIFGAIMTFQGKSFHYWIIGNQVERHMSTIMNQQPSRIYIALIVFVLVYVLSLAAYFLIAMIGQANA